MSRVRQFLFPIYYERSTYFYTLSFPIFSRESFIVLNQKMFAPYELFPKFIPNFLNSFPGHRYSEIRLEFPANAKKPRRSTTFIFAGEFRTSRRTREKPGWTRFPAPMKASLAKESKRITDRNSPRISVARFRVSLLWESSAMGLPMGTTCRYLPTPSSAPANHRISHESSLSLSLPPLPLALLDCNSAKP